MAKVRVFRVRQVARARATRAAGQSRLWPPQDGSQHSSAGTQVSHSTPVQDSQPQGTQSPLQLPLP